MRKNTQVMKGMLFKWLSIALALIIVVSCNDEDEEKTIAQVQVVTFEGEAVPFALVEMDCQSSIDKPCEVFSEGLADATGLYETEWTYSKVMKVNAYRIIRDTQVIGVLPDTTQIITADSMCGETFISILEGQTNRQTVVLYECN